MNSTSRDMTRARTTLVLFLLLVILRPHPDPFNSLATVYVADAGILILCLSYTVIRNDFRFLPSKFKTVGGVLIGSGTLLALWLMLVAFLDSSALPEATVSFMRVVYYAVCFVTLLKLLQDARHTLPEIAQALIRLFAVVTVVAGIQILEPPVLTDTIHYLWNSERIRGLSSGYPRIFGTFFNPNWFGMYLTLMTTLFTALLFGRRMSGLGYVVYMSVSLALLLATGSRSGVLSAGVGVVLVCILSAPATRPRAVLSVMSLICVAALVWTQIGSVPEFTRTVNRFVTAVDAARDGDLVSGTQSVSSRFEFWTVAERYIVEKPILGFGTTEVESGFIPHNSYVSVALIFGFLGSFALALLAGAVILSLGLARPPTADGLTIKRLFIAFTIALGLGMVSADFILTTQVFLLWIFLAALTMVALGAPTRTGCRLVTQPVPAPHAAGISR